MTRHLTWDAACPTVGSLTTGEIAVKVKVTDKIGVAKPGTMKAYRKNPGDFTSAAQAASSHAKKLGKPIILVPGLAYMSRVWHLTTEDESLGKFGIPTGGAVLGAHVCQAGNVHYAELS